MISGLTQTTYILPSMQKGEWYTVPKPDGIGWRLTKHCTTSNSSFQAPARIERSFQQLSHFALQCDTLTTFRNFLKVMARIYCVSMNHDIRHQYIARKSGIKMISFAYALSSQMRSFVILLNTFWKVPAMDPLHFRRSSAGVENNLHKDSEKNEMNRMNNITVRKYKYTEWSGENRGHIESCRGLFLTKRNRFWFFRMTWRLHLLWWTNQAWMLIFKTLFFKKPNVHAYKDKYRFEHWFTKNYKKISQKKSIA